MEYEYAALGWNADEPGLDPAYLAKYHALETEGWCHHMQVPFLPELIGGVCIMRRLKDEPRMWTERELLELMATDHIRRGSNPPMEDWLIDKEEING